MSNSNLSIVLAGIVGAAMAAGTDFAMSRWSSRDGSSSTTEEKRHSDQGERATSSDTIVVQSDSNRLDALRRDVEELRESREQGKGEGDRTLASSPEENQRQLEVKFSSLERSFTEDPPDPSWSREGTDYLATGMNTWGERLGFTVVDTQCRTAMCRATVQWENYEAAQRTGINLPEREIPGLNCVRHIWLEEPSDPDRPYSARLYLDCTDQRAGRVEVATTEEQGDMQ